MVPGGGGGGGSLAPLLLLDDEPLLGGGVLAVFDEGAGVLGGEAAPGRLLPLDWLDPEPAELPGEVMPPPQLSSKKAKKSTAKTAKGLQEIISGNPSEYRQVRN